MTPTERSATDVDLSTADLADALYRTARGSYDAEASVILLAKHNVWLRRADFRELISVTEEEGATRGPLGAWVDWEKLDTTSLPGSGSEARILGVARSLGDSGHKVDLSHVVTNLDREHLVLVLAALSHAAGAHEQHDVSGIRAMLESAGGVSTVTRQDFRDAAAGGLLGPVVPWPA